MSVIQTLDYKVESCEIVDIYKAVTIPNGIQSHEHKLTIFFKSNGELAVHGGCLLSSERRAERQLAWSTSPNRFYRYFKIVTPDRSFIEFERRHSEGYGVLPQYRMLSSGYVFGQVDKVWT